MIRYEFDVGLLTISENKVELSEGTIVLSKKKASRELTYGADLSAGQ